MACFNDLFLKKDFIYFYFQREEEGKGEREGQKHQCVVASSMPPTGDLATTQACAWTGNGTGDSGSQPVLNPLSHISQGVCFNVLDVHMK